VVPLNAYLLVAAFLSTTPVMKRKAATSR